MIQAWRFKKSICNWFNFHQILRVDDGKICWSTFGSIGHATLPLAGRQ
jgi:hypothetical protein